MLKQNLRYKALQQIPANLLYWFAIEATLRTSASDKFKHSHPMGIRTQDVLEHLNEKRTNRYNPYHIRSILGTLIPVFIVIILWRTAKRILSTI